MADAIQSEAVKQTGEAAQVIDKLAEHLGNAVGHLGEKFTQILDQYGPDAVRIIHEVGRVAAMQQVSAMVIGVLLFSVAFYQFLHAWKRYDVEIATTSPKKDLLESITIRLIIFGIGSVATGIGMLATWSLAAVYGLASPEAFLVIKLLKW